MLRGLLQGSFSEIDTLLFNQKPKKPNIALVALELESNSSKTNNGFRTANQYPMQPIRY